MAANFGRTSPCSRAVATAVDDAERTLAVSEPDRLVLPFAMTGSRELLEALARHETAPPNVPVLMDGAITRPMPRAARNAHMPPAGTTCPPARSRPR